MKARFFAFLTAVAAGSAAVLIYASQSRQNPASASVSGSEDCSACEMSSAKPALAASMSATDDCCAAESAKPAVATLATAGCPYVAGDTNATTVADVPAAKVPVDACCADEAAASAVSAQIER